MEIHGYFDWLCSIVDANSEPDRGLLWKLHGRPFEWKNTGNLARDENRAIDGKELRRNYIQKATDDLDIRLLEPPASVLEVLVALAINIDNGLVGGNGDEARWFWMMLENLGLTSPGVNVDVILDTWLYRKFEWNGLGSPFPITYCRYDQRKVELWLQACGYFSEPIEQNFHSQFAVREEG